MKIIPSEFGKGIKKKMKKGVKMWRKGKKKKKKTH